MLDMDKVNEQIEAGYISKEKHPAADLFIYNYTNRAQWDWHWTPETRACRGLIMDRGENVVARPFAKFFTVDQLKQNGESVPAEPFEAFEKYDGSLGVLYFANGVPAVSTRGAFTSPQAGRASAMLNRYPHKLDPSITLLFEIIYPENRIVVNYGDEEKLVLLAAIETATGRELPYADLPQFGFPVATRYDGLTDFDSILANERPNAEGFVVRFQSGMRVKLKFDEYKRLHKMLTGITPKHVWESLRDGHPIEPMFDRTPDEFHEWLRGVLANLKSAYADIVADAALEYRADFPTRKDAAAYFTTCKYPSIMFSMMDRKDYSRAVWNMVRPEHGRAFRCDDAAA